MISSLRSVWKAVSILLSWLPFIVFFLILAVLFLTEFPSPVDEYFIRLILRACLILIFSCAIAQLASLVILCVWSWLGLKKRMQFMAGFYNVLNAFPVVDVGIFSIAIFFNAPAFQDWVYILAGLLLIPTLRYWALFSQGPIRNLMAFARFHQVSLRNANEVLGPFYLGSAVDYFFVVLKRSLLPLTFVLVVMDFRIILPRLAEAGLSYNAFMVFISLIISLHLLSHQKEMA